MRQCLSTKTGQVHFDDDEGRAGDQVVRLEKPVDRGFGDEIPLRVREPDRQFPRRQLRLLESQLDNLGTNTVRDAIPDTARTAITIFEAGCTESAIAIVPSVKCRLRDAELVQGASDWQMGLFDEANDLVLF